MQAFDAHPDYISDKGNGQENGLTRQASDSLCRDNVDRSSSAEPMVLRETRDPHASKKLSVSDIGINWQRDSKGNFVTRNSWGKLLTRDDNGHMVEYKHFVESKRAGARNQMALTSVLFCNPLMLIGLGGAFAFMDHFHKGNSEKEYDRIKEKLEGKKNGKESKGYEASKDISKALLLVNDRRLTAMDALHPVSRAARVEEDLRKKKRKLSLEEMKRRQFQAARAADRSSLSRKNLIKMKKQLEEQLELMRGNASLKDIAKIETQIEKLDRALKRFSALSL